jgi:hypothetical protein
MKPVPYNTGKVKIGSKYVPPKVNYMSEDCEFIQSVLLGLWVKERRAQVKWIAYLLALLLCIISLMAMR